MCRPPIDQENKAGGERVAFSVAAGFASFGVTETYRHEAEVRLHVKTKATWLSRSPRLGIGQKHVNRKQHMLMRVDRRVKSSQTFGSMRLRDGTALSTYCE